MKKKLKDIANKVSLQQQELKFLNYYSNIADKMYVNGP